MITKTKRPFFSATRRQSIGFVPAYKSFLHRTRFLLLILIIIFNAVIYCNSVLINYAFMSMEEEHIQNFNGTFENFSTLREFISSRSYDYRADWFTYSHLQRMIVSLGSSLGTIISIFPIWLLIKKYGYRRVATISGILSSIFIVSVPLAIYFGFHFLVLLQFLQGCSFSGSILLIPSSIRKWSTRKNDHFCFLVLFTFQQVALVFGYPLYGYIFPSSIGWPGVFYIQSVLTFIITFLFFYFYKENPVRHANVSEPELAKIQAYRIVKNPICYEKVLKCKQFQTVTTSIMIYFLIIQLTTKYFPTYLFYVFDKNIIAVGWAISIMTVAHVLFKTPICYICDHQVSLITLLNIRILSIISFSGSAIVFLMFFFFEFKNSLKILFLVVLSTLLSFTWPSVFKASSIISGPYYLQVMVRVQIVSFITSGIIADLFVFILVKENDWRFLWLFLAILLAFNNVTFFKFFEFRKSDWEKKREKKIEQPPKPEEIAPVSHPRPSQFSTSFDDEIVVSIVSHGLDRCDTCRKHGIHSKVHCSSFDSQKQRIPTRKMFDKIIEDSPDNMTHM